MVGAQAQRMANPMIRPAAVAGQFYPDDGRVLRLQLAEMLGQAFPLETHESAPKALVVPHAGYIYSGVVAASAYRSLESIRDQVRKVVLLGPAHRYPLQGIALPAASAFATPLGEVEVDHDDWVSLQTLAGVSVSAAAHAFEHSLEVQLPFLQTVLGHFTLVPLLVGNIDSHALLAVIEKLWGGPETLIVVSSDLSHYLPYEKARSIDQATCQQILHFDARLDHQQACGATPLCGLLLAAARHRLSAQLLDYRNSGDTAGQRDRVVGYASFAFNEAPGIARH